MRAIRRTAAAVAVGATAVAVSIGFAGSARASVIGGLDASWGAGGKAFVTFNLGGDDEGRAMAIDSSGRIVIAGKSYDGTTVPHMAVARLNSDGTADTTFNGTGQAVAPSFYGPPLDGSNGDQANAIALQSDGKIVIAGPVSDNLLHNGGFGVARFNSDGSPDLNFGLDGEALVQVGPSGLDDVANGVAIQTDGSIVVAGSWAGGWGVTRLTSNGDLDTTFNPGGTTPGVQAFNLGDALADAAHAVVIEPDHGIVVVGSAAHTTGGDGTFNEDFAAVRLTPAGLFDTAFGGGDGIATLNAGGNIDSPTSATLQSDGSILMAGLGTSATFVVGRFTSSGHVDGTFGVHGKVVLPIKTVGSEQLSGIAVDSAGTIYAGGTEATGRGDAFVARLGTSGVLDTTFGDAGIAKVNYVNPGSRDRVAGLAIDSLGRVVAAGSTSPGDFTKWAVSRFYTSAAPLIVAKPAGAISCGTTASFSVAAGGLGPFTYQWQLQTSTSSTWQDLTDTSGAVSGAHESTLQLAPAGLSLTDNGDRIRVLVTGPGGTTPTVGVQLRVGTKPLVTLDPVSTSPGGDNVFHFTTAGTGSPAPTIQWFIKTTGSSTWAALSGATTTDLNLASFGTEFGDQVFARFRNFCGGTDSAIATALEPGRP